MTSTAHRHRRRPARHPAARPRLPRLARPGPGHRRLRRPHPPHRLLADPRPRRRRPASNAPATVLAPCGNRRAAVCPACSDRYAADAYHLLRAGLAGDDTKDVPSTVTEHPRAFLTLTAPVVRAGAHPQGHPRAGTSSPAAAGTGTTPTTPASAPPLDPDTYDYDGAVLWQAHAGALWAPVHHRPAPRPGRRPRRPRPRRSPTHARLSYAKVAEYQRRGLVHFHAVIRLDGPDGPTDPPPGRAHPRRAARRHHHRRPRRRSSPPTGPDGTPLVLGWGAQLDLRPVTPTAARQLEDERRADHRRRAGRLHRQVRHQGHRRHGEGADRPIRDGDHIAHLDVTPHHRRMIETAWQLGGLDAVRAAEPAPLGAHARLPRPLPHQVPRATPPPSPPSAPNAAPGGCATTSTSSPPTPTTTATTWPRRPRHRHRRSTTGTSSSIGHRDHAERELALAIAERNRTQRRTTRTTRRAAA